MASTANSVPAANTASGNTLNNASSQNAGSGAGRQALRSNANLKGSDGGRRQQSGSPVDGGQRRSNSQKAWGQNSNPLTQKSSYSQTNGTTQHLKGAPSTRSQSSRETSTPDSHAHDRLVFLLTSFMGLSAAITTKNGETFTGIFSSSSLEPNDSTFTLKMVQRTASSGHQSQSNGLSDTGIPFVGSPPEYSMTFDIKDVTDLAVANVSTSDVVAKEANGTSNSFRTDTDISGRLASRERNLQRWEPSAADANIDMSLESAGSTGWDQFEANERLFGATTSYDENFYTTRIDRSDPAYKRKEAEAARIAREIEASEVDNVHIREERGLVLEGGDGHDEEEKYSGVRRDNVPVVPLPSGQPNKYTPPARRSAAAGTPTTTTAAAPTASTATTSLPIPAPAPLATTDPAIISAQLAPSDGATKDAKTGVSSDIRSEKKAPPIPSVSPPLSIEKQKTAPSAAPSTTGPGSSAAPAVKRAGAAENTTANVETEVLDQFRQFANSEKMKMQERRRNQASHDRTMKLNELMKFSKNFKLATPVPRDLVPILAKDPNKQEAIIERAQKQAEEKAAAKAAAQVTPPSEPKAAGNRVASASGRNEPGAVPPTAPSDRQTYTRGRPGFPPAAAPQTAAPNGRIPPQTMHPARPGTGMLGSRLADNLRQQKGQMGPVPAPLPLQDIRMPPSGPGGDYSGVTSPTKGVSTPTSAVSTKFNVKAMEFKPNPAASTFTPSSTGVAPSPQSSARGRSVSRATSPSAFFGHKKPLPASERPSIKDQFNPIKRMKREMAEQGDKDYKFNGGIPPPYRTNPTWDTAPGNEEKKYTDIMKAPLPAPSISPQSRSSSNTHMPHQHQHPYHLQHQGNQSIPSGGGPPHGPHHLHPPQHHGSHYDDHRMQVSASASQMYPSPRLQHSHVAYPSPMVPHAQLNFGGQPMPQFYVNQGGPQPAHMRQYPGAPQFVNPQNGMGAPMMVQQPSSGPYMGVPQTMGAPYNPQMQMYSPGPAHAYPQHAAPPPQPHSGYPSPSRGAPMMMHQGSQSGQPPQPVMFMSPSQQGQPMYVPQQPGHAPPGRGGYPQQPHFSSSPHQGGHFPPHQHRTPSSNYNQVPPMPHMMAPQPPASSNSVASHPPETGDDVK